MKLQGLNVVCFERRHAETLADLVRLQGGNPWLAPAMKEVPLENNRHVFSFAEELLGGKIDVLVLLTGVGTKSLMAVLQLRYSDECILGALRKITIVPRGPKSIRVLNVWNVPYAVTVPEPNTWRELVETLDRNRQIVPLKGKTVAIQEYGVPNNELIQALEHRGAIVLRVPVYRWELPDDLGPLKTAIQAISEGKIDVAVFTTAVQIEHALQVAAQMGLKTKFLSSFEKMAVASVGPDCSEALIARGVGVDIQPESPKMGSLIMAVAENAADVLARKRASMACVAEIRSDVLVAQEELKQSPFLKACRREKTPFTPVWLMRQAGRYMKDYRDIREKVSFLDLCKNVDLITEVTVHAQQKIGADAAIIFSDILLVLEPMGLGLTYSKGDGPVIGCPVRSKKDVENLRAVDVADSLSFVYRAIRQTRAALKADIPLIGFVGAPFTLASYMIEGGSSKDFTRTKNFMSADEGVWKLLMAKIAEVTASHLNAQIEAGAQAVQLFDSWVGNLSAAEYEKYALPYSRLVIENIRKGVPVIYFGTKSAHLLELIRQAGADVIGADNCIGLDQAWKKIGHDRSIQGNLDPELLLGPVSLIREHVKRILQEAGGRPGHIFNLGHGVLPQTPESNVIALIEMVHEYKN